MVKPNIHLQNLAALLRQAIPATRKVASHLDDDSTVKVAVMAAVKDYSERLDQNGDDSFRQEGLRASAVVMDMVKKDRELFDRFVAEA